MRFSRKLYAGFIGVVRLFFFNEWSDGEKKEGIENSRNLMHNPDFSILL